MEDSKTEVVENFLSLQQVVAADGIIQLKSGEKIDVLFLNTSSIDPNGGPPVEHTFAMLPTDALRMFLHLATSAMAIVDEKVAAFMGAEQVELPAKPVPSPYL